MYNCLEEIEMMVMRILLALNHSLDAKEYSLDSECEVIACKVF